MSVVRRLLDGPDLLGLLERLGESDLAPVAAARPLCLNLRWRRTCSACADTCPVSAIDLEGLTIDAGRCVSCGACTVACPAGALALRSRPRQALLDEIRRAAPGGGAVTFACDRCGGAFGRAKGAKGSIVVPCLALVDEGLIIEGHARGAREVRLVGCDPACAFRKGRRLHLRTLRLSERLRRALGPGTGKADARPEPPAMAEKCPSEGEGRRDFLLGSGLGLVRAAYFQGAQRKGAARWSWTWRLPDRRAGLLEAARGGTPRRTVIRRSAGTPFSDIRADRARCSMCGACAALCPTGALGTVELDDAALLYFNLGWCTACMLCVRACPEGALAAGEKLDLAMIPGRGRVLLRFPTASCPKGHGRYVPERTGGRCPSCAKEDAILESLGAGRER